MRFPLRRKMGSAVNSGWQHRDEKRFSVSGQINAVYLIINFSGNLLEFVLIVKILLISTTL